MPLPLLLTLALAAQSTTPASDSEASIRLSSVRAACLSQATHPRIEATITPALSVADATLQFRSAKAKGWYSVSLRQQEGDLFTAHLPKPKWLGEFEYFVRATDPEGREVQTAPQRATLGRNAAGCEVAGRKVAVKDLIVRRPDGADGEDDGLPPGFSRRGTAGDVGMFELSSRSVVALTALTVGGLAASAAVMARGENPSNPIPVRPPLIYTVHLVNTTPAAGATVRLGDPVTLALEVRQEITDVDFRGPIATALRVDLLGAQGTPCLSTVYRPGGIAFAFPTVALVSPVSLSGAACTAPFAITTAVVTFLNADGSPFPNLPTHSLNVSYTFVP